MTTELIKLLSPATMQSLAWALLHFLWQGIALAAVAAALMALSRRAQVRYALGVVTLIAMLVAPFATFVLSAKRSAPVLESSTIVPSISISTAGQRQAFPGYAVTPQRPAFNPLPWLVEAWLMGVVFFSLRSAGGFFLIERERRRKSIVVADRVLEICFELQNQLGVKRAIQYCECAWLQAPAVIGWFRPIVFLPASALTGLSPEQLRMVVAHELAHIRRLDPFVNVFQVFVETVLFYHPAVWWLNKRIRAEREHCCDEIAVEACGNAVEYARALTLMEEWRSAPIFAAAANGGQLRERIVSVLGLKTLGSGLRAIGVTGSVLCLTAALLAGNALLGIAHPKAALAALAAQATAKPSPAQQPATSPRQTPKPSAARPQREEESADSYIDGLKSAGLDNLTVDQLIALKTQDVTPEYVRSLRDQGFKLDVDKIIAMRVQDITSQYVRDWLSAGLHPDEDQLIGLKVQGADAEYYRGLKEAGLDPDINSLIAMKVQGVTPEYVRQLRSAGFSLNAEQVIAMKVQDVTPEYVKALRDLGIQANTNNLIAMKVQDVTPDWVRGIQALGFKPSTNELIAMKVQDVTPDYIKALQSAGFKLEINEIIAAKVQDVTPEFIERAKQHGFKDLTLQKLIQLRQLGILDAQADL
ncbi:MAG TPA: M56 family metallopeptidase [Candidatus Sulfotelmatobacter sp.]|nr:M56 family metallopeptidase [Candidatus Sulfotelmatobacter sp.]